MTYLFSRFIVHFKPNQVLIQNKYSFDISFFEFLNDPLTHPKIAHFLFSQPAIIIIDRSIPFSSYLNSFSKPLPLFILSIFQSYHIPVLAIIYRKKIYYHFLSYMNLKKVTLSFIFIFFIFITGLQYLTQSRFKSVLSFIDSSSQVQKQLLTFYDSKSQEVKSSDLPDIFNHIHHFSRQFPLTFKSITYQDHQLTFSGYISPQHQSLLKKNILLLAKKLSFKPQPIDFRHHSPSSLYFQSLLLHRSFSVQR